MRMPRGLAFAERWNSVPTLRLNLLGNSTQAVQDSCSERRPSSNGVQRTSCAPRFPVAMWSSSFIRLGRSFRARDRRRSHRRYAEGPDRGSVCDGDKSGSSQRVHTFGRIGACKSFGCVGRGVELWMRSSVTSWVDPETDFLAARQRGVCNQHVAARRCRTHCPSGSVTETPRKHRRTNTACLARGVGSGGRGAEIAEDPKPCMPSCCPLASSCTCRLGIGASRLTCCSTSCTLARINTHMNDRPCQRLRLTASIAHGRVAVSPTFSLRQTPSTTASPRM